MAAKWNGLQCDQILTNIYDYIRSCINLVDSSNGTIANPDYTFSYTTPPTNGASGGPVAGTGQVVPIMITNPDGNATKGMGRFPTLRGATLQFIARSANQPPLMVVASGTNQGRPYIYDSTGALLSDSSGTITTAGWTTLLNGQAVAHVNPMHPWTCPVGGFSATTSGTAGQLLSSGLPVFAVDQALIKQNPNNLGALYPIFNLINTNTSGTPPTRTYPTLEISRNGMYQAAGSGGAQSITVGSKSYKYITAANNAITPPNYNQGNVFSAQNPQTHAGLEYLSVQRANGGESAGNLNGAFDIPNPNFKDFVTLAPYQTRIEAILILDPVDVASGNAGYWPDYRFEVKGLNQFQANGIPMDFPADATQIVQLGSQGAISTGNPWMPTNLYGLGWQETIADRALSQIPSPTNFPSIVRRR